LNDLAYNTPEMTNGIHPEEKTVDPQVISRSVEDRPEVKNGRGPGFGESSLFWLIGQQADEITPWGRASKIRDRELREFITTEPLFASALGIVCSRNAAFSWKLEGPDRQVRRYQKVLEEANFGKGWVDLIVKVSVDLYTQDNGAFIEVIRQDDSENSPVLGLNHLDSQRCYHTGDPMQPVIYMDRKGRYHLMKWYQIIPLTEIPAAIEGFYGLQYCALTRMLRAAQIIKNISIYDYERTGGRHTRAIHLLKGITAGQVQEAIDEMTLRLNARGQQRYSQPLIVGSIDPKADIGHDTLELASLPDNLTREEAYKWYIGQIAMAFLEDYQTFAPLPGGNLGSSGQSEVLHAKARGKGPALFQKIIGHSFNFQVLPESLEFVWDEMDMAQENQLAQLKKTRAQERLFRIQSMEITPGAARQIALDVGDLSRELFEALGGDDVTADVMAWDDTSAEGQLGAANRPRTPPLKEPRPTSPLANPRNGPQQPPAEARPTDGQTQARVKDITVVDEMFVDIQNRVNHVLEELGDIRTTRVKRVFNRDEKGIILSTEDIPVVEEN
jgi:hypothetical protein